MSTSPPLALVERRPSAVPRGARVVAAVRAHAAFAGVMAAGVVLRAWHLGATPSPGGDEGNWSSLALQLFRHRPAVLSADAAFVTRAFAWMMAGSYAVFGPSFASGRLVPALCGLLGATVAYIVLRKMDMPRGALVVASVMSLHPWSVAFSRNTTVPYEISLAIALCAPLLIVDGVERRRRAQNFVGIVLLFLGFQFSPLAILGVLAVFLDSLRPARRIAWRWPETWGALALGAAVTVPVVLASLRVARTSPSAPEGWWGWRIEIARALGRCLIYTHAMATSVTGDATVRDFTNWVLPPWLEILVALSALVVIGIALRGAARHPTALGTFARTYLVVAFVGVGVMLRPVRHWYLNSIDTERYAFAVLAPFALLLAAAAEQPEPWRRRVVAVFLALTIANATTRLASYFVVGGGRDGGAYTWDRETGRLRGSGYRWWIVPREREALPDLVREAVEARVGRRPVVLTYGDYAFHALSAAFAWDDAPVELRRTPPTEPTDRPQFFLLWSDGAISSAQPEVLAADAALRARMEHDYCTRERVHRWVQPNGAPFVELWQAQPCP